MQFELNQRLKIFIWIVFQMCGSLEGRSLWGVKKHGIILETEEIITPIMVFAVVLLSPIL